MDRYKQFKAKKVEQVKSLAENTKRSIAIAERMKSNADYAERIGEYGNRLHIWNIEEGDVAYSNGLQDPKRNFHRFQQDAVYQKLQGVRNMTNEGYSRRRGANLTCSGFMGLVSSVVRGLMNKIQNRQMTEQEYTSLLEMPRAELYNQILLKAHNAHQKSLKEVGYTKKWSHNDEDFAKLREAAKNSARTLETAFNIDLSEDYPVKEKRYTPQDLKGMEPTFARYLILAGKVDFE